MIEIVIDNDEKVLLEKSNIINNKIYILNMLLSYNKFDNDFYNSKRKIFDIKVDINKKIKELDNILKKENSIRLWYSEKNNENVCLFYFLCNYLYKKNINIYIIDIKKYGKYSLKFYHEDEIKNLLQYQRTIEYEEIKENKTKWDNLIKYYSDLRTIINGKLESKDFTYLNNKLINIIIDYKTLTYHQLIAIYLYKNPEIEYKSYIKDRINELIKEKIITVKKQKNLDGTVTKFLRIPKQRRDKTNSL